MCFYSVLSTSNKFVSSVNLECFIHTIHPYSSSSLLLACSQCDIPVTDLSFILNVQFSDLCAKTGLPLFYKTP
jgi:hypothetical protein